MPTLVAQNLDPTLFKPPRRRRWVPVSLRISLAIIAVVGGWLAVRTYRQQTVIHDLRSAGVRYSTRPTCPEWARRLLFNWGCDVDWLPQSVVFVEIAYNVYPKDFDPRWFAALPDLEVLRIEAAWFGTIDLKYVAGLANLRELSLRGSQVSDHSLRHIEGLSYLRDLDLSGTKITDAGLPSLKRLKNLESLSLWDTRVTDAGLWHLKGLSNLQWLQLDHMQVSDAGVADLQRALPALTIVVK